MYIAISHSQPQREGHGLQSNRFVKLPSCPLAKIFPVFSIECMDLVENAGIVAANKTTI